MDDSSAFNLTYEDVATLFVAIENSVNEAEKLVKDARFSNLPQNEQVRFMKMLERRKRVKSKLAAQLRAAMV